METIANDNKFAYLDTGAIVVFLLKFLTCKKGYESFRKTTALQGVDIRNLTVWEYVKN